MAVEFKKLKSEWSTCEKKINDIWGDLDGAAQTEKNLRDWLEGAREHIVERTLDARKNGHDGKTVSEFTKIPDIKKVWGQVEDTLKKLNAAHDRYQSGIKAFKPLYDQASKISQNAKDEVKERKKKKLVKSKSLPDLEKLAKEIDSSLTATGKSHMASVADFAKQKPKKFTFDQTFLKRVNSDIASGKNLIKDNADDDAAMRRLAPRQMAVATAKMQKLAQAAKGHCAGALKAKSGGDSATASAELEKAIKIAKAAQGASEEYARTMKKKGSEVKAHKDGKVMIAKLNNFNSVVKALLQDVAKTQKALGQ